MSPDDPLYEPIREIAAATRALVQNIDRLTINTEDTKDLIRAARRVERALGWGMLFAVATLLVVLVVLVVHVR